MTAKTLLHVMQDICVFLKLHLMKAQSVEPLRFLESDMHMHLSQAEHVQVGFSDN